MQRIKFCPVYVQKNSQDCTGKGITYHYDHLDVLIDVPYKMLIENGKEYYDRPDEKKIRAWCVTHGVNPREVLILCDKRNNPIYTPYLKPLDTEWGVRNGERLVGPAMGGNYVLVSIHGEGPWGGSTETVYRVHDRYDTQQDWDGLSR